MGKEIIRMNCLPPGYPVRFLVSPAFIKRNPPLSLNGDWHPFGDWPSLMHLLSVALCEVGLDVKTVIEMPTQGVVIAHTGDLNLMKAPPSDVYLLCYQGDWYRSHWANGHIVSNNYQATDAQVSLSARLFGIGPRFHLPFIPEPHLTPRDPRRGTRFESASYMGTPYNLIPELHTQEWQRRVARLGMTFRIEDDVSKHGDYSQVDVVIAVRPDSKNPKQKFANKLWNAWRAGVPAILGPEPGFQEVRQTEYDYIEARNEDEIFDALALLKSDITYRRKMIDNGLKRTPECSLESIVGLWKAALSGTVGELYHSWMARPKILRELDRQKRNLRNTIIQVAKQCLVEKR